MRYRNRREVFGTKTAANTTTNASADVTRKQPARTSHPGGPWARWLRTALRPGSASRTTRTTAAAATIRTIARRRSRPLGAREASSGSSSRVSVGSRLGAPVSASCVALIRRDSSTPRVDPARACRVSASTRRRWSRPSPVRCTGRGTRAALPAPPPMRPASAARQPGRDRQAHEAQPHEPSGVDPARTSPVAPDPVNRLRAREGWIGGRTRGEGNR